MLFYLFVHLFNSIYSIKNCNLIFNEIIYIYHLLFLRRVDIYPLSLKAKRRALLGFVVI